MRLIFTYGNAPLKSPLRPDTIFDDLVARAAAFGTFVGIGVQQN